MRFIYDHTKEKFIKPTQTYNYQLANFIVYGENKLIIKTETVPKIILKHFTSNFFIYIIACLIIWSQMDYVNYAIILFLMSMYGIVNDVIIDIKNNRNVERLARVERRVKVKRNNYFVETDSKNIFPNDIIVVEKGKLQADYKIVEGEVVVDEGFLTGESVPVYKRKGNIVRAGTVILECKCNKNKDKNDSV